MNKTTSRRILPGHTAYLAALLLVPLASIAEVPAVEDTKQVPEKESVQLNTVVVQGQKIDREVQDTISGVSVATGDELAKNGALDLSSAFADMSNVNAITYGNGTQFAIRGIQSGGVSNTGKGSLSSVLIDGLPLAQPSIDANIPLWDVDQVVVAKGPMSTSVGQNSAAGAVFITSKKPEFENGGAVRAGIASYDSQVLSAMGNLALTESLALRVTADQQKSDGQHENIYLNDDRHDFRDNESYKASLLFQPSYKFSAQLTLGHDHSEKGSGLSCTEVQSTTELPCKAGDFKASQDIKPRFEDDRKYGILDINSVLNDQWTLNSLTTVSETTSSYQSDLDRNHPDSPNVATFADGAISSTYMPFEREGTFNHLGEELRLTFENENVISATGLYYAEGKETGEGRNATLVDASTFNPSVPAGTLYIPVTQLIDDSQDDTTSIAIFNETDIKLASDFTLTLGARYSQEKREYKSGATAVREKDLSIADAAFNLPSGTTNAGVDGFLTGLSAGANTKKEKTFTEWLPKLGLSWNTNEHVTLGYIFSKGYRSGGSDLNIGQGTVYDYDAETLSNHELSLRSVWLEDRLVVNANVYYLDWKNQQVRETLSAAPFDDRIVNAGSSESQGAELDVFFNADNGFNSSLNIGYSDTEFKKFKSGNNDYSGNKFTYSPDWNISAALGYDRGEGFNAKWRTQYTGETYALLNNENKVKGYFLSHITAGYKQEAWQVDAYVNNVFDHEQVIFDYEWTLPTANSVTLVPGRVVGMIGQYKF
jgi:outer membrane receptor protein involved in Fe transport